MLHGLPQYEYQYEQLKRKKMRLKEALTVNINIVALSGNITRDAEVRQTKSGTAITKFGLAFNDRRKDALTGEYENKANFIDVTMFGNYGAKIAPSLTKGTKIALNGSLRYSEWEKDGHKSHKIEAIADVIDFIERREKSETLFDAVSDSLLDDDCPF